MEFALLARAGANSLLDFVDLLFDVRAMAVRTANGGLLFPMNVRRHPLVLFAIAVVKRASPSGLVAQDDADFPRIARAVLSRRVA